MPKSNHGLIEAAETHLRLLRDEHEKLERQGRTYIPLAFTYGMTVPEICEITGFTAAEVQEILGGG